MLRLHFIPQNGVAPTSIRRTVANFIAAYPKDWLVLSIEKRKDKRTLDQNSYYRGAVLPHVRKVRFDFGDALSMDEVHEDLLEQFAPRVEGKRIDGTTYSRPLRTHEMSVEQMSEFIEAISAQMAMFGQPVPREEA